MNVLSKDELTTILWALDSKMESVLHDTNIDEEDLVVQKKLYEQLSAVYFKIQDMWKSAALEEQNNGRN